MSGQPVSTPTQTKHNLNKPSHDLSQKVPPAPQHHSPPKKGLLMQETNHSKLSFATINYLNRTYCFVSKVMPPAASNSCTSNKHTRTPDEPPSSGDM